jgi:catechol 2,3-dioxygenase-like lactoylglutathione lyase family enzyme
MITVAIVRRSYHASLISHLSSLIEGDFVSDVQGNGEWVRNGRYSIPRSGSMTRNHGHRAELDHLVLEVRDPVRSVRFYSEVLGLPPVRLREYLEGEAPFPSVRISRGIILDMFPPRMWRGRKLVNPNHFCLAYSRAGLNALRMRLKRRKVAIVRKDDHNYGARGHGRAIYFRDPDGLLIEARFYP